MKVPAFMLKKLYVPKSLANEPGQGFAFRLKNTLADATLLGVPEISVDGEAVATDRVSVAAGDEVWEGAKTPDDHATKFKRAMEVAVRVRGPTLPPGKHKVEVKQRSKEFETLGFDFEDTV